MKHTSHTTQPKYSRQNDIAILFLRLFIGAVVLLHIIGKLQTYDNTIHNYPPILRLDAASSFAVATILEGLLAAMIVLGVATRFASVMMTIISALVIIYGIMQGNISSDVKLNFIYIGIYITLMISGGGYYAFNIPDRSKKWPK